MTLDLVSAPASAHEPPPSAEAVPHGVARVVTALIVGVPLLALLATVFRFWGRGVHIRDLIIAAALYLLTGHGVTIGYHRLLAHRSFLAVRPLKLALVALASMAYVGGPIGWVATHRRHHVFSDTLDDPHSPRPTDRGVVAQFKGLWHAHWGWLFTARGTSSRQYASDLRADRDLVVMDALFPLWCVVSMAIPFGLGWFLGGTLQAALSALLWAGLIRVALLHHATWSINSLCHSLGRRPFTTKDRSSNIGVLALVSMGESWHNNHHAFPRSARHGLLPHQWDTSAALIRTFGRLDWVRQINLPAPDVMLNRRRTQPSGT